MKKHLKQTPTYIFIMLAVLGSWSIAFTKAVLAEYPNFSSYNIHFSDLQHQYIFAFLFQ